LAESRAVTKLPDRAAEQELQRFLQGREKSHRSPAADFCESHCLSEGLPRLNRLA
jgi:hypothetical protein